MSEVTLEERVEKLEKAIEILASAEAHRVRSIKDKFEELLGFLHPDKVPVVTASVTPEPEPEVTLEKPPTNGKGSSVEAWKAYAESLGIEVSETAKKDAIIEGVAQFEALEAERAAEAEVATGEPGAETPPETE